jgi:hypothetical protein
MRILLLTAFIACYLVGLSAYACELLPEAQQREADRRDMELQRTLVDKLVLASDAIVIAKAVSVSADTDSGMFEVTKNIEGQGPKSIQLAWRSLITVGCYSSAWFVNPNIKAGDVYLLYVQAGRILRAASFDRNPDEITFTEELRRIRKRLGPNNSFKPKPLRGSA